MPSPSQNFYIYYRIDPRQHAAARQTVKALLNTVEQVSGCHGRWLAKVGEPELWMEVYESVNDPAAFEQQLDECVRTVQFERILASGASRHTERFSACA